VDNLSTTLSLPVWPEYAEDEIAAVEKVLREGKGNYWFGDEGKKFEQEFAAYCESIYALAVSNGTVALELALRGLNIKAGDEIIVTPRTFVASVNCIVLLGAKPVFADIDSVSQNISVATVEAVITSKTKAIIAVHLAGWPCAMEELMALASRHDLYVVEDCAQAHGASVNERKVGGLGHVAAFSFCHDKIMSAGGEGGLLVTNDEEIWARAASFRNHGKDPRKYNPGVFGTKTAGAEDSVGSNYRLTEMQSAICRKQLVKLDDWVKRRRRNAKILDNTLKQFEALTVVVPPEHIYHAYYKYYFFVDLSMLAKSWSRERIINKINQAGVPCSTGTTAELYKQAAFIERGYAPENSLPNAQLAGETSLMLPVAPNLTESNLEDMCTVLTNVIKCSTR
jgi:dTDP-4-amino-4,6-dideoxygalactose transaminase